MTVKFYSHFYSHFFMVFSTPFFNSFTVFIVYFITNDCNDRNDRKKRGSGYKHELWKFTQLRSFPQYVYIADGLKIYGHRSLQSFTLSSNDTTHIHHRLH